MGRNRTAFLSISTTPSECSSSGSGRMRLMMRLTLLAWTLTAVCHGILPEIVHSGFPHILEDNSVPGQTQLDRLAQVEQPTGDPQQTLEDALHQKDSASVSPRPNDRPPSRHNDSASDTLIDGEYVRSSVEQEANNTNTSVLSGELGNNVHRKCLSDEDCVKGSYCLNNTRVSRCVPCKAIDMSCDDDKECCGERLCVWGQCSLNATKGAAGSTCQYQTDCSPDLCCLFHKGAVRSTVLIGSLHLHYVCLFCLCFQPCSSPCARPSPSSASAALGPPTTCWSCCPGTFRTRDPANIAPAQEISTASTSVEAPCALKERTRVKRTRWTVYTQR
ncbi:dickkopf-related protein 3a isoform 1-T1 [Spinachia spinachia]